MLVEYFVYKILLFFFPHVYRKFYCDIFQFVVKGEEIKGGQYTVALCPEVKL